MNEPQLSAEGKLNILELVDPKVPYSHFVRVLEKYTQEVIATALEEQATRHTMLMAGLEAQIEQKAVIRASELVDKARATALEEQRKKYLLAVEMLPGTFEVENDGELLEVRKGVFDFKKEVIAKLNQMKGNHE